MQQRREWGGGSLALLHAPYISAWDGIEMGKTAKNYYQISRDTISSAIRAYKRTRDDTAKTIANAIGAEVKTVESWLSPSTPVMPDTSNLYALIDYWGEDFGTAIFSPIGMEMREVSDPADGTTEAITAIKNIAERYLKESRAVA